MSTKKKLSLSTPTCQDGKKGFDLNTKMMVINGGKKVNVIARDLKLSYSNVSTTLKDKERICEAVQVSAPMQSIIITKQRTGLTRKWRNCCTFGWKIRSKNGHC